MKLDPKGVEKAATAVFGYLNPEDDRWPQYKSIVEGTLTAYFDYLKSEGLMREGRGWDHSRLGYWSATSSNASILPDAFIAAIICIDRE
jgi:hypothetical protein